MKYENFNLYIHSQDAPAIGCGYYYIVTSGTGSHTAFKTRRALKIWLHNTGLRIGKRSHWGGRNVRLVGSYTRSVEMLSTALFFKAYGHLDPFYALENGSYSVGFVERSPDGNTLHIQNVNTDRPILDYAATRAFLDQGTRPGFAIYGQQ